ncbi:hypothetical protein Fmac_025508 [Flemingia macrophylla]|uniref:Uncharacterized protein n=1 Tax=Flemingia macrophylla TaxID=520843 RepID=A0ABD1LU83_9FABA
MLPNLDLLHPSGPSLFCSNGTTRSKDCNDISHRYEAFGEDKQPKMSYNDDGLPASKTTDHMDYASGLALVFKGEEAMIAAISEDPSKFKVFLSIFTLNLKHIETILTIGYSRNSRLLFE